MLLKKSRKHKLNQQFVVKLNVIVHQWVPNDFERVAQLHHNFRVNPKSNRIKKELLSNFAQINRTFSKKIDQMS